MLFSPGTSELCLDNSEGGGLRGDGGYGSDFLALSWWIGQVVI